MRFLSTFAIICAAAMSAGAADEKIKVLIIDGQNNHNWQQTTPVLKKIFEDTGRFTVDVATSPPPGKKEEMAKFRPDLSKYQVVVSNYNGERWCLDLNADLDILLSEAKIGFVVIHAANNAFGGWKEYNQMIGMGWRGAKDGKRLKFDDDGKEILVEAGKDDGSGHRYSGPFTVKLRDTEHPITKGMPKEWMHVKDELYDNMRGPIEKVTVLATAYSKGTKVHEPMIWTVAYEKGRVFHTPMGHDATAMKCWGFAATVTRGTEWAATGKVTLPLPKEFPTAEKASPIPDQK